MSACFSRVQDRFRRRGLAPFEKFEWWSRSIPKVLALCLWNGVILQDDEKESKVGGVDVRISVMI